jgi:hypothetical protein
MGGINNAVDLFIVPGVITAVIGAAILTLFGMFMHKRSQVNRQALRQGAAWQRSYDALRDANDAVICEIEANPATYHAMIPASIRDQIYAAHSGARAIEGK